MMIGRERAGLFPAEPGLGGIETRAWICSTDSMHFPDFSPAPSYRHSACSLGCPPPPRSVDFIDMRSTLTGQWVGAVLL